MRNMFRYKRGIFKPEDLPRMPRRKEKLMMGLYNTKTIFTGQWTDSPEEEIIIHRAFINDNKEVDVFEKIFIIPKGFNTQRMFSSVYSDWDVADLLRGLYIGSSVKERLIHTYSEVDIFVSSLER